MAKHRRRQSMLSPLTPLPLSLSTSSGFSPPLRPILPIFFSLLFSPGHADTPSPVLLKAK